MDELLEEIENERERLTRLVNKAIQDDQSIGENEVILAQSRKLDVLMAKLSNQWIADKQKDGHT